MIVAVLLADNYKASILDDALYMISSFLNISTEIKFVLGVPDVKEESLSEYYSYVESMQERVSIRTFLWRTTTKKNVLNAANYQGVDIELINETFLYPDDSYTHFCDCGYWIIVSDKTPYPVAPFKPYGILVSDYVQRYSANFSLPGYVERSKGCIHTIRQAQHIFATNIVTLDDCTQYCGINHKKLYLLPRISHSYIHQPINSEFSLQQLRTDSNKIVIDISYVSQNDLEYILLELCELGGRIEFLSEQLTVQIIFFEELYKEYYCPKIYGKSVESHLEMCNQVINRSSFKNSSYMSRSGLRIKKIFLKMEYAQILYDCSYYINFAMCSFAYWSILMTHQKTQNIVLNYPHLEVKKLETYRNIVVIEAERNVLNQCLFELFDKGNGHANYDKLDTKVNNNISLSKVALSEIISAYDWAV